MCYYQNIITIFAGKKLVLMLTAGFFTLTSMAQERTKFSGEWKLNESKSKLGQFGVGNKVCLDWLAEEMGPKTMKIAGQADFITVDVASSSPYGMLVKLTFDGKESEATLLRTTKKSTVKWSDDGQTMTVNSVIYLNTNMGIEIKVIEVWKLINDGKSISLQSNSNSMFGENAMKLVYDKTS